MNTRSKIMKNAHKLAKMWISNAKQEAIYSARRAEQAKAPYREWFSMALSEAWFSHNSEITMTKTKAAFSF